MALIGEIAVNIVARHGAFTKGMNAVRKNLETVGKRFATFGGIISGGMLAAVKSFSAAGDQLIDMSKRTGVAVEALSGLQFAAEQSGASLASVEIGLKGMAKAMLTAEQGSKTMIANFSSLGLTVDQLATMSPEQQFLAIADRLAAIENPTQKAALAMKVFGRSGTDLIPMLDQGVGGIAEFIKEAEKLGIVMSTKDAVAAAELDDTLNKLGFQFKAVMKEIAVAVSGPLMRFLEGVKGAATNTIEWIRSNQSLVAVIGMMSSKLAIFGGVMISLSKVVGILTVSLKALAAAMLFITKHPLIFFATLVAAGALKVADMIGFTDKLAESLTGVGSAAENAANGVNKLTEAVNANSTAALEQRIQQTKKTIEQLKGLQALSRGGGGTLGENAGVGIARDLAEQRRALRFLEAQLDEAQKPGRKAAAAEEAARLGKFAQDQALGGALTKGFNALRDALHDTLTPALGDRVNQGFLGQLGDVFNALKEFHKVQTTDKEPIQEIVRASNAILQKGTQEAVAFAAQHRQREQGTPEKKIEKNTADTVKAVNGVKSAINDLSKFFGREPVFTIPAS